MKKYLLIILIIFNLSCKEERLDTEKIDFETRKIIQSSWLNLDNLLLTKKSQTEKKLYRFYETQMNNYRKDLTFSLSSIDTMTNHKDLWIDDIKMKREERLKKSSDPENEAFLIFYPTAEDEYQSIITSSRSSMNNNKRKLDSIESLYKKTSENDTYHEMEYKIKGYSEIDKSNIIINLRVWVDNDSRIFKHLFLDLPQKTN